MCFKLISHASWTYSGFLTKFIFVCGFRDRPSSHTQIIQIVNHCEFKLECDDISNEQTNSKSATMTHQRHLELTHSSVVCLSCIRYIVCEATVCTN